MLVFSPGRLRRQSSQLAVFSRYMRRGADGTHCNALVTSLADQLRRRDLDCQLFVFLGHSPIFRLAGCVAEVEFTEWTPDGHLRHSKFVGLRNDKDAMQVGREG